MPQQTKQWHVVLFTGDREWRESYAQTVKRELRRLDALYGQNFIVIVGGAPGVDTLVETYCESHNIHCAVVKALWNFRRNSAGPQRNEAMLALKPDEVIAIHGNFSKSRGTKDCVEKAKALGIPWRLAKIRP